MSDNWVAVIPRDPHFVPSSEAIERAKAFMGEIAPEAEDISVEITDAVRFRDCGANFEGIRCPVCNSQISFEWWSERMDEDSRDDGFTLGSVSLPCGHTLQSLNELNYYFDQGFSRFILDAMNPNIREMEPIQITQLEQILECPLKVIYQHI